MVADKGDNPGRARVDVIVCREIGDGDRLHPNGGGTSPADVVYPSRVEQKEHSPYIMASTTDRCATRKMSLLLVCSLFYGDFW